MIDNPNPSNFYNQNEMEQRKNYIPKAKLKLINSIKELLEKIENEEPFPDGNITIDNIISFNNNIDEMLYNWYY